MQHVRLLLVGRPGSELRLAARLASDAGAEVAMADDTPAALQILRARGAGLVMIEVGLDIAALIASMHRERFTTPVLACGVDAPAHQAVAAIRAGALDYVPLPPQRDLIAAALATAAATPSSDLVGEDAAMTRAVSFGIAMAGGRMPILITGEKGTGKELLARKIHDASGLEGRFEVVECAGVPDAVLASELFGHEAGAFDGAVARRTGRIESAARGTVFLRDIDRLPGATQAMLAAALQASTLRRVGGSEACALTARLIASASSELGELVAAGEFRADLAARLELVRLSVPPLRQRGADLALLAARFAEMLAAANGRPGLRISDAAAALLSSHDWPGNVRELHDTIHRAVLLAQGDRIEPEDLVLTDGRRLAPPAPAESTAIEVKGLVGRTVEEVERELILQTLERCHGNRTSASNILGISVRTMRNKLKSFIEAGIAVSPAA